MDPFIEAVGLWEDFHSHLIEKIAESLAAMVPEKYLVRTGERAYVVLTESGQQAEHSFKPDVGVTSRRGPESDGGVAVQSAPPEAESVTMRALITAEYSEAFVEIHTLQPERALVTCIEVLSPSNKRAGTPGWELYQRKRQALLLGEANLVEIDLLRGGKRLPMVDPWPDSPYTLLVSRRATAPICRVLRAHYAKPLPLVPVPLLEPDPDAALNLQLLIDDIYRRYRYDQEIDYGKPLTPPLPGDDVARLQEQLRTRAE
jgi:hypothetical protein